MNQRLLLHIVAAASLAAVVTGCADNLPAPIAASAAPEATWVEPGSGRAVSADTIIRRAAAADVVLLGEVHDNVDHHRWQLHTLAAIHGRRPEMVIGVEMLPRRAQPALDDWVAGRLDEAAFLDAVRWRETWGFDPALYMPLFHFARLQRIPLVALNVDRRLVARVARDGWAAVAEPDREGVGDPASPPDAYRQSLAEVFGAHQGDVASEAAGETDTRLARFTEAQLLWDRAMAEAISEAASRRPDAVVVGIAGSGHLAHGWGIPHQLVALGAAEPVVLLPIDEADAGALPAGLADAAFVLPGRDHAAPGGG